MAKLTRIEQAFYARLSTKQKAAFTRRYNANGRTDAIKYAVRIVTSKGKQ